MFTATLSPPVTALVAQSVVLNLKLAWMLVASVMPAPHARFGPEFTMVANTVAVVPTCTDRLDGSTAATRLVAEGSGEHGSGGAGPAGRARPVGPLNPVAAPLRVRSGGLLPLAVRS